MGYWFICLLRIVGRGQLAHYCLLTGECEFTEVALHEEPFYLKFR